MKKAILISIRPEWVAKILTGKKTIEIRKTAPKCELPIDVYIYCTKGNRNLYMNTYDWNVGFFDRYAYGDELLSGKVAVKFKLAKATKFADGTKPLTDFSDILQRACLTKEEALEYRKGKPLFAWHISDLDVIEEPKELSDFFSLPETYHHDHESMVDHYERKEARRLKHAPQSWRYVEVDR